jgi:phosphogluconate dehydratase
VPLLENGQLKWITSNFDQRDKTILSSVSDPFNDHGGIKVLKGNLGVSVIKTSAVLKENMKVKAPAVVFSDQESFKEQFKQGSLNKDMVAVIKYQGPKANGMPELHQLTPMLSIIQNQGYKVALLTDGRMSGASGKVPAAIHLSPEAIDDGPISKLIDGDIIELDAHNGTLNAMVSENDLIHRTCKHPNLLNYGCGRELFDHIRSSLSLSTEGASIFNF